jgi:hypothetical protein
VRSYVYHKVAAFSWASIYLSDAQIIYWRRIAVMNVTFGPLLENLLSDIERMLVKIDGLWGMHDGGAHGLRRNHWRHRTGIFFKKHVDRKTLAISYSPIGVAKFSQKLVRASA